MTNLLNLIYPNVCGFCNKVCKNEFCNKCKVKIRNNQINVIIKPRNKYFKELISIFKYEGIIRDKILQYKFEDKAYMYNTFVKIILKNEKICGLLKKYDIIIPVPIHKKRKTLRGYNQSELIAKKLSDKFKMPMYIDVLKKQINTIPQSSLGKKARKNNAQNVYKVDNMQKIKNKNVVILDDIYTTGATANECIKVLKDAGAYRVGIVTIAKD